MTDYITVRVDKERTVDVTDNPHYLTMEDYLKILEETLRGTGGMFFGRPSHPEDIGAAVEFANKNVEAVLSYQVRQWWIDRDEPGPQPKHYSEEPDFPDPY